MAILHVARYRRRSTGTCFTQRVGAVEHELIGGGYKPCRRPAGYWLRSWSEELWMAGSHIKFLIVTYKEVTHQPILNSLGP